MVEERTAIDADVDALPLLRQPGEPGDDEFPRLEALGRRYAVLEIEDERIGLGLRGLLLDHIEGLLPGTDGMDTMGFIWNSVQHVQKADNTHRKLERACSFRLVQQPTKFNFVINLKTA